MTFDSDDYTKIQAQADTWWMRLRSGEATRADAQAFKEWCARSPEHARAWRDLNTVLSTLDPAAQRVVQRDPSCAGMPAPARRPGWSTGRRSFLGGALAASAAGWLAVRPPLGLWPSVLEFAADYHTGTGEQRRVALSDQVTVQMNTQTRINVRTVDAEPALELLAGEAEIHTTADLARPMMVTAGNGRLLARRARFNVRYTGPEVCVTCLDGAVEVDLAQPHSLAAGQQLTYDTRGLRSVSQADPQSVSAWRSGSLVFTDAPLSLVIDEINRYRSGRVILRDAELGRRRVRMRLSLQSMDSAVKMIRDLAGAKMTELPGNIVILS